jgi:hypothetical protein
VSVEQDADSTATRAGAGLLEPVPLDEARRRRGRWWFVVVPLAAIALMVAVALQSAPDRAENVPPLPEMSPPPVALPPLESASARAELAPSTGPAASASRRPSTGPASRPATGAGPGGGGPGGGGGPPTVFETSTGATAAAGRPIVGIDGRCIEPAGGASGDGTPIRLAACGTAAHQRWTAPGDGTYRTLGKCLSVSGGDTANRTAVVLDDCTGSGAEQWQVRSDGTWRNPRSNRCLDAENGSSAPGTRLIIWDCHGGSNQRWLLA